MIPFVVSARVFPTGITASNVAHFAVTASDSSIIACNALTIGTCVEWAGNIAIGVAAGLSAGNVINFAFNNDAAAQLLFTGCEL